MRASSWIVQIWASRCLGSSVKSRLSSLFLAVVIFHTVLGSRSWLFICSIIFYICCSRCVHLRVSWWRRLSSWFDLRSTGSSSRCSLFSQLSVVPLQVLEPLLLSLRLLKGARDKVSTVSTMGRVWGQRVRILTCDREMHCVFLSHVPVSHIVEVEEAHVVALDRADLLASLVHLTPDVVLLPEEVGTVL